jgi:hypothetical protein
MVTKDPPTFLLDTTLKQICRFPKVDFFAKYIYFANLSQAPARRQADRRAESRSLPRLLHGAECDVLVLLPHQAPRALVEAATTHSSFSPAAEGLSDAGVRKVSYRRHQESC